MDGEEGGRGVLPARAAAPGAMLLLLALAVAIGLAGGGRAATVALLAVAALGAGWWWLAERRLRGLEAELDQRRQAEAGALRLACHDPLTSLVNRRVFVAEVDRAVAGAGAGAVVLIDLDDFKTINDLYGHAAGDAVLCAMAERLRAACGPDAVLARLGGDEFAVLLATPEPLAALVARLDRIARFVAEPLPWGGASLRMSGSVGAARFPLDATQTQALLHAADTAMYRAKRARKGSALLFHPRMVAERMDARRREDELRLGLTRGELVPFYQPVVRLADRGLCGFEVLARWRHPRLGLLLPADFVALADRTGQLRALLEAVLRQACRDAAALPAHLSLAVNISPGQLAEPDLADLVLGILAAAGLPPARLEVEVTEDAVIDEAAARTVDRLRGGGVRVALDDFGTGCASLASLGRLRFDRLKIDRSFVQCVHSENGAKLVEAILRLGASFAMAVTAEGVDTEAAAARLRAAGCDAAQGHLFGKALPFADALALARQPVVLAG